MAFLVNESQVRAILPGITDLSEWYELIVNILPKYNINTNERIAGFIAQTGHESRDWSILEENLNYSASALNRVFPRYFRNAGVNAQLYHRQPQRIANRVYANRMGNGPEESGDGWRYRGRGLIQLTGKNNYQQFANYTGLEFEKITDYVGTKTGALESACWFWEINGLNSLADRQDIRGMSRRINGGFNGIDDRKLRYRVALDTIAGDNEEYAINLNQILRIGSRGETVRSVQEHLNIDADGIFGPATQAAVMDYQKQNGLGVDGVLGPQTLGAMFA